MFELPKLMSKKMWFLLFNVGTILYLIISGALTWDAVSVFSCGISLALMNGVALISAREYKNKYKGW